MFNICGEIGCVCVFVYLFVLLWFVMSPFKGEGASRKYKMPQMSIWYWKPKIERHKQKTVHSDMATCA